MRYLAVPLAVLATPALAHHEVVVATSIVPLMGWLAVAAIGVAGLIRKRLGKAQNRDIATRHEEAGSV